MTLKIKTTTYEEIKQLRNLFLQENNFQIRYNACHERNWSDTYEIIFKEKRIGYASVKGKESLNDRDAIFEFYIIPAYRKETSAIFKKLIQISEVSYIESQTNIESLSALVYEFSKTVRSEVILFKEHLSTKIIKEEVVFRNRKVDDKIFGEAEESLGDYVLEKDGAVIAIGGFLTHYNMPFADLFMEVDYRYRNQGYGRFILQEIKKVCYLSGRIPAARCNKTNEASRATLLHAGFKIAGYMICGELE